MTKRKHVRVASFHDIYQQSALAERAKSVDHLNFCYQAVEEMEEKWKANLQVIFVCPSGISEFERRVETVRHAIMSEMDKESAQDMQNYQLAERRAGICKMLLKPQDSKAAEKMGILGCEKKFNCQ